MKRGLFAILFVFLVNVAFGENVELSEHLQELISGLTSDPLLKPVQEDLEKMGNNIVFQAIDSEIEERILSNLILFGKSVLSGNFNTDYSSYSAQINEAERDYNMNKNVLNPCSVLRWLCPYYLGFYYYMHSSDLNKAINYLKEADLFVQTLSEGKFNIYHSFIVNALAQIFTEKECYADAIQLVTSEMCALSLMNCSETFTYAQLEYSLARIYSDQGDDLHAINHFNSALALFNKHGLGESLLALACYNALASSYASLEDDMSLANALETLSNSFELHNHLEISDSDILLETYRTCFYVYYKLGDLESILNTIPGLLGVTTDIIRTKIPFMTESERYRFWNSGLESIYYELLPCISWLYETGPMSYYMYYALLQSRGIQLYCNNYFSNLLVASDDDSLKNGYRKLASLKSDYTKARSERRVNKNLLSELKEAISNEEHNLLRILNSQNHDILSWMNVSVENIQSKLCENELAVEFFAIPLDSGFSYSALVINNDSSRLPEYIDICKEAQFVQIKDCQLAVSDSIWSKIVNKFPNATKIFFAPCGELTNYPIEHCINESALPSEFSAVRLSSTREIVLRRNPGSDQILVMGDFNYNQPLHSIIQETEKITSRPIRVEDSSFYDNFDEETSGIYEQLPGAGIEIKDVSRIFGKRNVLMISNDEGIESTFKALSGYSYSILHIATHGFFNNHGNNPNTAMDNCGLIFSGINTLDNIDCLPPELDDGKLTASEIANLDLWGTDLVCLSACSSGKSTISSDGAFGLQRGFKLAGVNSIIMSLWDIKDKGSTNLMMKTFYSIYKSTRDKWLAYTNAIKKVRQKYPDFKDWASFIIIDPL